MHGFTRTIYGDGYKYTMVYPPGWKYGDSRQPEVHKEPCVPEPSDPRIAETNFFEPLPYPERTSLSDRQPHSTAARSRQPVGPCSGVVQGTPKGVQCAQKTVWSHSLRTYLAQTWLPKYVLSPQVNPLVRYEWPHLRVLVRAPRTRELYLVQRIFEWDLRRALVSLKQELGDARLTSVLAEQGKLADLTLPDTTCSRLDEHDVQFLNGCRLNAPSDVTRLVQEYPLRTIIKVIKLFLNILDDHPVCARLKFNDVNHLCPARNEDLFDLIALPGTGQDDLSLLIVVAPPWDIKYDDLEEFAGVGVPDQDLSLLSKTSFPSDTLRAVIWDICLKHNCRYFVLTTYNEWVFGTLSPDMHRARVTRYFPAPIFPREMSVSAKDVARPCFPVPNVFELLLLWIFAAGDDDHIWWPQPPDMPVPVHPSKLSILDGGWADMETGL